MAVTDDLGADVVAAVLGPHRQVRSYPALLSTEAAALAWAHQGAPEGAVVVADYQASPRGRGGLPWRVTPGRGLGFTLIRRPLLPPEREGWPYVAALTGLRDVVGGEDARIDWPDTVHAPDGEVLARLGVHVELAAGGIEYAGITVLVEPATPPRAPLLGHLVTALEARLDQPAELVLADFRARCGTLGRVVRALLIPVGPGGPEVEGEAVDVRSDGALVLLTRAGRRVAVPPQNLARLEGPAAPAQPPPHLFGRPPR